MKTNESEAFERQEMEGMCMLVCDRFSMMCAGK